MAAHSATTCKMIEFSSAVETFVRGHCFMKSFAYPYVCERVSGLWILKDGVGEKPRRESRRAEVVAYGLKPEEVAEIAGNSDLGKRFISHMHTLEESPQEIRAAYKALGYRSMLSEEFFVHDMADIPQWDCKPPVRRVVTIEDSDRIKSTAVIAKRYATLIYSRIIRSIDSMRLLKETARTDESEVFLLATTLGLPTCLCAKSTAEGDSGGR